MDHRLREQAVRVGANAVINLTYRRGPSGFSWKALTANGTAVVLESAEIPCPYCAEPIQRAAVKCKHCGSELEGAPS